MLTRLLLSTAAILALSAATTFPVVAQTTEASVPAQAIAKRSAVAQSDGLTIHYDVLGDLTSGRRPLLVLHGAYMSADSMTALTSRLAATGRPLIVLDQRGHGRTGDAPGPITYERLADDAAAVLRAAGVSKADVVGYSMGASAGIQLAVRHPELVDHLVSISGGTRLNGMYPEVLAGIAQITPELFNNTPIRTEYDRQAPRPQDFPILVDKLKALDAAPFDWDAAVRGLTARTFIITGDYDVVTPEHAVEVFRLRGGGAVPAVAAGFLTEAPPARLAILPATSHIGVMAEPDLLVALINPFLNDAAPPMPEGFF